MDNKDLEKIAIEYLGHSNGCPTNEKFMIQNLGCEKCSEDQNLSKCWRDFLIYWKENYQDVGESNMKFRINFPVKTASGSQTFEVEAITKEEAFAKLKAGEGKFIEENVEVEDLGEVDIQDVYESEE